MKATCQPRFFTALLFQVVCSLLVVLPLSTVAESARDDATIDEVVVEAFRLPTEISETGVSAWIVDEETIESRGYLHMTDVLTTAPGVTINQNGAFGGQASARIRGASSDQTLVLIDGIVGNDTSTPGGGFNAVSYTHLTLPTIYSV